MKPRVGWNVVDIDVKGFGIARMYASRFKLEAAEFFDIVDTLPRPPAVLSVVVNVKEKRKGVDGVVVSVFDSRGSFLLDDRGRAKRKWKED
jgi:hypothetical protein